MAHIYFLSAFKRLHFCDRNALKQFMCANTFIYAPVTAKFMLLFHMKGRYHFNATLQEISSMLPGLLNHEHQAKKYICVFRVSRPYLGFCHDPKHFIVNCEQNVVKSANKWGKMYWKMQFLYKIFWQNKMLCWPTIPSFLRSWNTHIFFFLASIQFIHIKQQKFYCNTSHIMKRLPYAICEQQRSRSACTSVQSDQQLCCSLLR